MHAGLRKARSRRWVRAGGAQLHLEAFDLVLEAAAQGSPTGQFAEISDQPMPADHQPGERTAVGRRPAPPRRSVSGCTVSTRRATAMSSTKPTAQAGDGHAGARRRRARPGAPARRSWPPRSPSRRGPTGTAAPGRRSTGGARALEQHLGGQGGGGGREGEHHGVAAARPAKRGRRQPPWSRAPPAAGWRRRSTPPRRRGSEAQLLPAHHPRVDRVQPGGVPDQRGQEGPDQEGDQGDGGRPTAGRAAPGPGRPEHDHGAVRGPRHARRIDGRVAGRSTRDTSARG